MSGVRRKRRGSSTHAMEEQLGVTLGVIKPCRRFVPGFIGETWLRRDSRICEGVPTVSEDECQLYHEASSIPVQPKVWCQVNIYVLFPNKCVRIFCIGVLLTIVFLNTGWYRLDWASANYI